MQRMFWIALITPFTALQLKNGDMAMTSKSKDKDGIGYFRTIIFYSINKADFEWKSNNVYRDKVINTSNMSCKKVAEPPSN